MHLTPQLKSSHMRTRSSTRIFNKISHKSRRSPLPNNNEQTALLPTLSPSFPSHQTNLESNLYADKNIRFTKYLDPALQPSKSEQFPDIEERMASIVNPDMFKVHISDKHENKWLSPDKLQPIKSSPLSYSPILTKTPKPKEHRARRMSSRQFLIKKVKSRVRRQSGNFSQKHMFSPLIPNIPEN